MSKFQRFEINTAGRDFAVGDVHGYFTKLQAALDAVGFNPGADRLFSVGDLIDRGPESSDVDTWLAKPWFFAVQGNHEKMAVEAHRFDLGGHASDMHAINGGAWLYGRPAVERTRYHGLLAELPVGIEVMTAEGLVGIVHADCPFPHWWMLRDSLSGDMPGVDIDSVETICQWSRSRIAHENNEGVRGVRAVIVGHTVVRQITVLGNVYHIDTGGWMGGHFTLIDLDTLQCHPPENPKPRLTKTCRDMKAGGKGLAERKVAELTLVKKEEEKKRHGSRRRRDDQALPGGSRKKGIEYVEVGAGLAF